MTLPWFKWFPADWLACETRFEMSLSQRGLYRELLDINYAEGSISANPDVLKRMCACDENEFQNAWSVVSKHFEPLAKDSTRLANKRALSIIGEQAKYKKTQRLNGQKGGRPPITQPKGLGYDRVQKQKPERNPTQHNTTQHNTTENIDPISDEIGGERASAQPAPAERVAKVSKLEPKLESFGEFSRAKLTQRDREALDEKLGSMAASYIARFDRWVEEAPDGKQSGVKRKDRKAYPSILNWYDRDIKDGRITDGRTKQQQRNDADDEVLKRVFAEETGLNYNGHSWVEESLPDVRGGAGPGADQILLPDFGGSRRSGTG